VLCDEGSPEEQSGMVPELRGRVDWPTPWEADAANLRYRVEGSAMEFVGANQAGRAVDDGFTRDFDLVVRTRVCGI
jgi:hypothetical protein